MKISELLLALLLGYVVSSMFVIVLGEHGFEAFGALLEQKQILINNISELKETQLALQDNLARLTDDSALVKILSRELGYYDSVQNEEIFMLQGYDGDARSYHPGKMIFFKNNNIKSDLFFRVLGFLVGFMVYTIILVCVRITDNGTQEKQPSLGKHDSEHFGPRGTGHNAMRHHLRHLRQGSGHSIENSPSQGASAGQALSHADSFHQAN